MEHQPWPWKRKSVDKTAVEADKANTSLPTNEDEIWTLLNDKADMEKELKILNGKLSSALSDCNAKDELAKKQALIAQEAILGWEKTESEAIALKEQLDRALQEKAAGEERLLHLDAALKECMNQLRFVREEQARRIRDAVMKASKEFDGKRILLEAKLAEASKRLSRLGTENTQLSKGLLAKEKVVEDFKQRSTQMEADFKALRARLESTEKGNASLKYEVRVLEEEVEIWNEEREFNRRATDVVHKQYLESAKKIAKLESECQRLRLLLRKRLPGPAALAKMRKEVEILGGDPAETRRKSNASPLGSTDVSIDMAPDTPSKRIQFLTQQLNMMEEENRTLKEALNTIANELQTSRKMHAHTTPKSSSRIQEQLEESRKPTTVMRLGSTVNSESLQEVSVTSMSDMAGEDKVNCGESWASALLSELEHFRNGKQLGTPSPKSVGVSDINLMDDFVEMERLAVGSANNFSTSPHRVSQEGDVKVAFAQKYSSSSKPSDKLESSRHLNSLFPPESGGRVSQGPADEPLRRDSSDRDFLATKKSSQEFESNVNISLCKMIALIEGTTIPSLDDSNSEILFGKSKRLPYNNSETPTGYTIRVLQWKTSELSAILKLFVETCRDLLHGKANLEMFAHKLTCTLEWILNHCFSIQDVSSMKDAIKNQFDRDDSRSESEVEGEINDRISDFNELNVQRAEFLSFPSASSGDNRSLRMEELQPTVKEDARQKKELSSMGSAKKDLEGRPQSEIASISLITQVQESEKTIECLQEVKTRRQSKETIEDQIEEHRMVNEDLLLQLSMANMEVPHDTVDNKERLLQNDWEIATASEKLAECKETILNLGKQLKPLASHRDAELFDKVISTHADSIIMKMASPQKNISQRSSLLDIMLADDNAEAKDLKSPKTKETIMDGDAAKESPERFIVPKGVRHSEDETSIGSLAIVPAKKKNGGGLLKKLLWRQRRTSSK